MKGRIKFYSVNDMALGYKLERAGLLIELKGLDVNDLIELVNLKKYVDHEIFLKNWDANFIEKVKSRVAVLNSEIGSYFGKMEDDKLGQCYEELDLGYKDDFVNLIELGLINNKKYKLEIKSIIEKNTRDLHYFLSNKKITKAFKETLKKVILKDPLNNIQYILEFFKSLEKEKKPYYISNDFFTNEEIELALKIYIESENPNINYLELIHLIGEKINPKIQLKAKKIYDREIQKMFKNGGISNHIHVSFENMDEDFKFESIEDSIKYSYSLNWLSNNLNFPTILNNFIYLFYYVSNHFEIDLISRPNNSGVFERAFSKSEISNFYNINTEFNHKESVSEIQLNMYYYFLNDKGIRIEDIIKWFFKGYLKEEFEIDNFSIEVPSKGSNYMEKCTSLITSLERIFKIYNLYVEDKEIELGLLPFNKSPLKFSGIKSLLEKKYIYLNKKSGSNKLVNIMNSLFSDQSSLSFVKNYKYKTFFDALMNGKLLKEDFQDYNISYLDYLLKEDVLKINELGEVKVKSLNFIFILKNLYYNDVLSYWKCLKGVRDKIDNLIEEEILVADSTLLSKPEQDYFSYYFNNEKFINAPALRNHYGHASIPLVEDKEIHQRNYFKILKLVILAIIKINDDIDVYNKL